MIDVEIININLYEELEKKREYYNLNRQVLPQEVIANYEDNFSVEYAHNSTAIEGNTLSLIEAKLILEDKISVGGKAMREIYELVNHAKAFDYVKRRLAEGKKFDEDICKDIHQILTENIFSGGIYRNVNVRITGAGFQPPSPEKMYVQIKNFYADLSYRYNDNSIVRAAWIHAEFVRIHPFADGNGRTARMLMNYQLMADGWLPVSVPKNERIKYYEALEAYGITNDIKPFANYIYILEDKELDRIIEMIKQALRQKEPL